MIVPKSRAEKHGLAKGLRAGLEVVFLEFVVLLSEGSKRRFVLLGMLLLCLGRVSAAQTSTELPAAINISHEAMVPVVTGNRDGLDIANSSAGDFASDASQPLHLGSSASVAGSSGEPVARPLGGNDTDVSGEASAGKINVALSPSSTAGSTSTLSLVSRHDERPVFAMNPVIPGNEWYNTVMEYLPVTAIIIVALAGAVWMMVRKPAS